MLSLYKLPTILLQKSYCFEAINIVCIFIEQKEFFHKLSLCVIQSNFSNLDRLMEARPKMKINLTHLDKVLEISGIILLIIMWTLAAFNYYQSLETVPIHFNLSGQPDSYGSKVTLLLLPIIPTVIYFGMTQLNKYPHIFNYMTKITEENAKQQYTIATRMIRILKASVVLIFTIDILSALLMTFGMVDGLSAWSFPVTILILAVPTIYLIVQSLNKKEKVV